MSCRRAGTTPVYLCGLLGLGLAVPAWSNLVPCPTNPATVPLSTYDNPTSLTNGCTIVNNTFSNFSVPTTAVTGTINGFPIPTPNVAVPPDTSLFLTSSIVSPGSVEFSSPGPDPAANTAGD